MKILILIGSLEAGGAERVASVMANFWSNQGHEVILVTSISTGGDFYNTASGVIRRSLEFDFSTRVFYSKFLEHFDRMLKIRTLVSECNPDILIGSTSSMAIRVALFSWFVNRKPKCIGWEHHHGKYMDGSVKRFVRNVLYRALDRLIVLTNTDCENYPEYIGKTVIANPIEPLEFGEEKRFARQPKKRAISVGSLVKRKGFDRMIRCFRRIVDDDGDFGLDIYGDGPELLSLQNLIVSLGLQDNVRLMGIEANIRSAMFGYDVFLLTSHSEGMPMVILESFSTGLPVVAMDCETGPRELLGDSRYGILVVDDDEEKFASAVIDICNSPQVMDYFIRQSFIRSRDYQIEKIGLHWDSIFN